MKDAGVGPGARSTAGLVAAFLLVGVIAEAQVQGVPEPLRKVGIDQLLNQQVPLDLKFHNEEGREVALREYFRGKPVILSLVYYHCPMLCTLTLEGLVRSLRIMPLNVGNDFDIVTVSFDPSEKPPLAAESKAKILESYRRPGAGAGWHFLTGDQPSIDALVRSVGFRYVPDKQTGQFAHAAGIMVLTPEGKTARYLFGVDYAPRDLRLALVEASAGKIGSRVDQMLLYCFHYDATFGKYTFAIMSVVRILGGATVLILGGFLIIMFRRERHKADAR
jgi:protein SCO1/2